MSTQSIIKVVIVDDHDIVRYGLKIALDDYENIEIVGEASDGQSAIDLCQEVMPDVVLMDLIMPEMNGLTATRMIRQANPQMQIIILTSFENETSTQDVLSAGAVGYIAKNLSIDELIDAIYRAFNEEITISKVFMDTLKSD